MEKITSTLRLRMSAKDAHYGGELVDGAHMVHLFGDVATELLIKLDGDEGLFCAYDNVEFLAPTYAGDYIEAYGEIDQDRQHFEKDEVRSKKSSRFQKRHQRFCCRFPRRAYRRCKSYRNLRNSERNEEKIRNFSTRAHDQIADFHARPSPSSGE